MRRFAELYAAIDESTRTTVKVTAMVEYFRIAPAADAAWAVAFLIGRKPRQVVPSRLLREWAAEAAAVPQWLFEESYHAVGDLAETIALLLPMGDTADRLDMCLARWVEDRLLPLADLDEPDKKRSLLESWRALEPLERFVWNKLITGAFRVGVSQSLVTRALADIAGLDPALIAHRLMGHWRPSASFFQDLVSSEARKTDPSRLYPFCLAYPMETSVEELGDPADWAAEWKWDGIRAQLIRRGGQTHIWTRGEELVTERYPDLHKSAEMLPDGTVIDGELLPWNFADDAPLPFAQLQKRIGRKNLSKKILADVPVVVVAYDLLEADGKDLRDSPFDERRKALADLLNRQWLADRLRLSPEVSFSEWKELATIRADSRQRMCEGLMLKRRESPYRVGRRRGDWWKWKVEPLTMDCVLTMAQRGSGRRASLYTDYTFAVWDEPGGSLLTIAKAYSGLTDAEIAVIDAFVKRNTTDKFGPVRAVKPEIVMELAFEAIQLSPRHKSGIAVRFPRIVRIRSDKKPEDADTLDRLKALLASTPKPFADEIEP
jgi:DNA ligase-1